MDRADLYRTSSESVVVDSSRNVPLRIVERSGRGRSVIAVEAIAAGTLVERAPVVVIPEEDRAAVDLSTIGGYIFMWEPGSVGEDIYTGKGRVAVVLGYASVVNHSYEPNCCFVRHIEARTLDVLALRDIPAREEITFDYGMTLWFTPE